MDVATQMVKKSLANAAAATKRVYRTTADHAQQIARAIASAPAEVTTDTVIHLLGMDPQKDRPKVLRWLDRANTTGLVVQDKRGSAFLWRATEVVRRDVSRELLNRPLSERPKVGYNPDFLDSYVPNRTFYLPADVRRRLESRSPMGSAAFEELSRHDKSVFMCGLSQGSSALEGNPYNRLETVDLIEKEIKKKGATEKETFMVLNHHDAVRYIVENSHFPSLQNDVSISGTDIRNIHALLSYHLLDDSDMCGTLRRKAVTIYESAFTPLPYHEEIARCFQLMCDKAKQIENPFEAAFFLLVHLPYLQPFEDCNKRTSRVASNIPLLRSGVLPMSWVDTDVRAYGDGMVAVYEQNNTSLLAEVFHEGYMRSSEEFEAIRVKQVDGPNEIAMRYRAEIRQVVRSVVQDGGGPMPDTIDQGHQEPFGKLVFDELARLARMHPGTMVQYQLTEGHILAWRERDGGPDADDPAAGTSLQLYDESSGEDSEESPGLTVERG